MEQALFLIQPNYGGGEGGGCPPAPWFHWHWAVMQQMSVEVDMDAQETPFLCWENLLQHTLTFSYLTSIKTLYLHSL